MIKKYDLPSSKQGGQGMIVFSLVVAVSMTLFFSTGSNYSLLLLVLLLPNYLYWANIDVGLYREYSLEYNKQLSNVPIPTVIKFIEKNRLDDPTTCKYLKAYIEKYHTLDANLYSKTLNSL